MSVKYDLIFEEIFKVKISEELKKNLIYRQYPQWDSLAQMILIQRIEEEFGISIPFDEMMKINSYGTTVLVATHEQGMAEESGKRIIRLDHGRTVEEEVPRQEAPGFDVMPIHNAEFNGPFGRMRSFGQTEQFLSSSSCLPHSTILPS